MSAPRLLPLSGILAVVLIVLAFVLGGGTPDTNASAAKVMSFYSTHDARQIAASFALATSVPFLVLFAAGLASALWPREPGVRPVWELVLLAGGALAGGTILLAALVHFALVDGADHLSSSTLQVLNVVDGDGWIAWNAGIGVMMLGAGGSLLTRAAGSRWLGRTALLLGILLFVPFADFFALLASGVWILGASTALFRRPGLPAYATGFASVAVVAAALAWAAPASAAGNAGSTQIETVDPTGALFTCPGTDYTVLGGELRITFHFSTAADGSVHVRQSHVPLGVTLGDGTTNAVYRLVGANSGGGNIDIAGGSFEFTDTTFFDIVAPGGGVVARVAGVEHVGPAGGGFSFVFGDCEAPQE